MKYYKDAFDTVYAYESDGSQDDYIKPELTPITEEEAMRILNPPPTPGEVLESNTLRKEHLIDECNNHINSNQWPSKLALGRLSDAEKATFNKWLDYLDALNAVDPADPVWPTAPSA
ncbi:tail fiber assembly protein [Edwardsiella phage PEi21]|uniref:Tail fiber assembly protein n=1 Tax=Edwardsiella phage PEi21 TaxID=1325372 RepID=N0DPE7_9CAUD|nr:tail fiber assembly protein [Edwardsiella phage PEi21]QXV72927.1 tail fiber assembly protein [Edwardsiella phage PVN06]BAN16855.1 tail fiber assembly protein [Edwardsiella phage PEi21]